MYMGKDEKEDEMLFYLYAAKSAVSKQKCEMSRTDRHVLDFPTLSVEAAPWSSY